MGLALFCLSTVSYALPSAFTATYDVKKSGMTLGNMQTSLSYNGNQYHYHKKSKTTGLASLFSGDVIVENADGIFNGEYLQPRTYLYHHISKRKNRKTLATFLSPTKVSGTHKDQSFSLNVSATSIDRATLELALARDLLSKKTTFSYLVIEKDKQKRYDLNALGDEVLTINGISYHCKKMIVKRDDQSRKTIFWLAKETDFMPVKINHAEKGDSVVSTLKTFSRK